MTNDHDNKPSADEIAETINKAIRSAVDAVMEGRPEVKAGVVAAVFADVLDVGDCHYSAQVTGQFQDLALLAVPEMISETLREERARGEAGNAMPQMLMGAGMGVAGSA